MVKKMHGIQIAQSCDFIASVVANNDSGQSQLAQIFVTYADNPAVMEAIAPQAFNPALPDLQLYMKRLYMTMYFNNGSQFNQMLEVFWCTSRDDIDSADNPIAFAGTDFQPNLPYISPVTSNAFTRRFKIYKSKKYMMAPGRTLSITVKSRRRTRPMTYIADANSVRYNLREGNRFLMYRVYGTPVQLVPNTGPYAGGACLSPYWLNRMCKRYFSYYRMDISDATSSVENQLPVSIGLNDNKALLPTRVNVAVPSTYNATYIDYNGPNYVYANANTGAPV